MELYDMMRNIYGKNTEEELIKAISSVRETLNGLVEERMCKVYSSFLLKELNNRHIPARLINTLDIGLEYEHIFILVPFNDKNYFLADLTFSQFNKNPEQLNQLLTAGYQLIDNISLNYYLDVITENHKNQISVEDIFYLPESNIQNKDQFKK